LLQDTLQARGFTSFLTKNDLTCKRPGTGLSPAYYDRFIGRKTKHDIPEDTLLQIDDIE